MIYIKPILKKHGKKALDFISYICDERRELNLQNHKNKEMIKIMRNGEEGKIYIHSELLPVLNEYLKL